jgi:hypothetical protein
MRAEPPRVLAGLTRMWFDVDFYIVRVSVLAAILVGLLTLLSACAPTVWVREGTELQASSEELALCSRDAWAQAQSDAFMQRGFTAGSPVLLDRTGRFVDGPSPYAYSSLYDPALREPGLFNDCMRRKGYEPVPEKR